MTIQAQVRVFPSHVASFGGVRLRRLSVSLPHQNYDLLLHEGSQGSAFVLEEAAEHGVSSPLHLKAEWGEALGQIQKFTVEASGQITAFELLLNLRSGDATPVTVGAGEVYWSGGELYCRKRLGYALRDVQKGKRARVRSQAA